MKNKKKKMCRYGKFYNRCEQTTCTYILDNGGCTQQPARDSFQVIVKAAETFAEQREEAKQYTLKF